MCPAVVDVQPFLLCCRGLTVQATTPVTCVDICCAGISELIHDNLTARAGLRKYLHVEQSVPNCRQLHRCNPYSVTALDHELPGPVTNETGLC